MNSDTICAIATATGGAIGIIRLSGPDAISIASRMCPAIAANTPARSVHLSPIYTGPAVNASGTNASVSSVAPMPAASPAGSSPSIIDEALVTLFRAPHSYTGEDSVEFSLHGSPFILSATLQALIAAGARQAEPGEFTLRAFLNGKLDLSQAEAVADLIASTNRATHQVAMSQLRGRFSSELKTLRDQLLQLTSLLELELDFSDHEELEFADRTELLTLANTIDQRITRLAHSFETGQALKSGIPVAIVGKTNVGKSTLLNALLGDDRAIVSDIHGTTRDTIEDTLDIHGVQFRFIDTAGIRQTSDAVERIGIERTYAAIDRARIVLWLFDSQPTQAEITDIKHRTARKSLLPLRNKADLLTTPEDTPLLPSLSPLPISAKQGMGLEALKECIYEAAHLPELSENDLIVTNARHYDALLRAHDSLQRVIDGLHTHLSSDLLAEDLRLTLAHLADITGGAITPQETLNNIFSHFCVGK